MNQSVSITIHTTPPAVTPASLSAKPGDTVTFTVTDDPTADLVIVGQYSDEGSQIQVNVPHKSPFTAMAAYLPYASPMTMTIKTPSRQQPRIKFTYTYAIIALTDGDATLITIDPTVVIDPP